MFFNKNWNFSRKNRKKKFSHVLELLRWNVPFMDKHLIVHWRNEKSVFAFQLMFHFHLIGTRIYLVQLFASFNFVSFVLDGTKMRKKKGTAVEMKLWKPSPIIHAIGHTRNHISSSFPFNKTKSTGFTSQQLLQCQFNLFICYQSISCPLMSAMSVPSHNIIAALPM